MEGAEQSAPFVHSGPAHFCVEVGSLAARWTASSDSRLWMLRDVREKTSVFLSSVFPPFLFWPKRSQIEARANLQRDVWFLVTWRCS